MGTYLITGGCGFIGSHLADALIAARHRVRILDDLSTGRFGNAPRQAEVLVGSVADVELVGRAMSGIDGCFHLAAVASVQRSNEAWLETHLTNLVGTIAVLDAARRQRTPVVFASSAAVYGRQPVQPLTEDCPPDPLTAYGADKLGCERHARVAGLVHRVPTAGLRFFNVYGPRQDGRSPYSGVISIFAERLSRGAALDVYGDGQQMRDFVYVGDVVRFLSAAMAAASPEAPVFNVCTGVPTSIVTLAATLARLCERPHAVRFYPARAGDIPSSFGCPERAAAALGVRAAVTLADGLKTTLASPAAPRKAA
ncbi:MAG: NAD-dependent epimerase/dehydratase family protein [Rhodospirillales bacterium]|nr:NAD-dependent epimerase/dehydratase family protein [Rhodospirillales bacterium]